MRTQHLHQYAPEKGDLFRAEPLEGVFPSLSALAEDAHSRGLPAVWSSGALPYPDIGVYRTLASLSEADQEQQYCLWIEESSLEIVQTLAEQGLFGSPNQVTEDLLERIALEVVPALQRQLWEITAPSRLVQVATLVVPPDWWEPAFMFANVKGVKRLRLVREDSDA